ncbi:hypothetical protein Scep_023703 [Stephania cephalantha]|uniref:Uncharacterized protein n=1 Tax=Stephania cephalantha TaxID=152367 RepID=A0AAP0HT14_9MAGN
MMHLYHLSRGHGKYTSRKKVGHGLMGSTFYLDHIQLYLRPAFVLIENWNLIETWNMHPFCVYVLRLLFGIHDYMWVHMDGYSDGPDSSVV